MGQRMLVKKERERDSVLGCSQEPVTQEPVSANCPAQSQLRDWNSAKFSSTVQNKSREQSAGHLMLLPGKKISDYLAAL